MPSPLSSDPRRVAIVTGAPGALGTAIATHLIADGLAVAAADVDMAMAADLAERLDPDGGRSFAVGVDVADPYSVDRMVRSVLDWRGRVDVLVNNAGVMEPHVPTWNMSVDDWQRVISVDLTGVFLCTRAVLPEMLERGWGRIVNISSIAGKVGKHNPVAYASAKAGVIGLTKAVAFEVASRGVLVNAVTPGSIWSPFWDRKTQEELAAVRERHPVGRLGRPDEVAAMVAWLASDECSFSTGAVFDISGGRADH